MPKHYPEENAPALNGSLSGYGDSSRHWPLCDATGVPMLFGSEGTIAGAGISDVGDQADHLPFTQDPIAADKWALSVSAPGSGGDAFILPGILTVQRNGYAYRTFSHTHDQAWDPEAGPPPIGTTWSVTSQMSLPNTHDGTFQLPFLELALVGRYDGQVAPQSTLHNTVMFNLWAGVGGGPPPVPPVPIYARIRHIQGAFEPGGHYKNVDQLTAGQSIVTGVVYELRLELTYLGQVPAFPQISNWQARGYWSGIEVVVADFEWGGGVNRGGPQPFPTLNGYCGVRGTGDNFIHRTVYWQDWKTRLV